MKNSATDLLTNSIPERMAVRDDSIFDFTAAAQTSAQNFMGWVGLAQATLSILPEYTAVYQEFVNEGLSSVVLVGQGGSSQASMTVTKLSEARAHTHTEFKTMDSLSPVVVNNILGGLDPAKTVYIISSKSGSTIEVANLERVIWAQVEGYLGTAATAARFVAITDADTELQALAEQKNYRYIFKGNDKVGGRFSAMGAYGIIPPLFAGVDIAKALTSAIATEKLCQQNSEDNPAYQLAQFIFESYLDGRNKLCLALRNKSRVFGLWIEQIVAESLGKQGQGILPNVEIDLGLFAREQADRAVIVYDTEPDAAGRQSSDSWSEQVEKIHPNTPHLLQTIRNTAEVYSHFVIWEYATAFLGYLTEVDPFDQPDVEITKQNVKQILQTKNQSNQIVSQLQSSADGEKVASRPLPASSFSLSATLQDSIPPDNREETSASLSKSLKVLMQSRTPDDFFAICAYLPFRGFGRRESLERMRHRVADRLGLVSCLEIGPRYLHSTGQYYKGGTNNGIYLVISSDESIDIAVPGQGYSLATLATTQAQADFTALSEKGRRALYLHLSSNGSENLTELADIFCNVVNL